LQRCAIATVCDGCGSQPHSEIGAALGVAAWQTAVRQLLEKDIALTVDDFWSQACRRVVAYLRTVVADRGSAQERDNFVRQHLLFTSIVAVIVDDNLSIFALGDGLASVANQTLMFGPWRDNQPPYLGYALIDDSFDAMQLCRIHTQKIALSGSVLIATDGALEYPGAPESLLSHRIVRHPDGLRRALELAARNKETFDCEQRHVKRQAGALSDDTAIAIMRWSDGSL
jgi:hypothetical protein